VNISAEGHHSINDVLLIAANKIHDTDGHIGSLGKLFDGELNLLSKTS
jgi:hypothetical protein